MNTFKKITLTSAVAFALFTFNACGDDSNSTSASGENSSLSSAVKDDESSSSINDNSSSSSVILSDSEGSSSSVKGSVPADGASSSSVISDPDRESSSSSVKSSSSSAKSSSSVNSSSSNKQSSSSSEKQSSSSSVLPKSSSSVFEVDSSRLCTPGYDYCYRPLGADSLQAGAYKKYKDTRNGREYFYLTINGKDTSGKKASVTVFAENLNVGIMVDGATDQKNNDEIERYCYNNDTTNCVEYGGLYQWAEMMGFNDSCNTKSCAHLIQKNHQGICPKDWRLMTYNDFYIVVHADGNDAGVKGVRSTGFGGLNYTGYSLIAAGYNWAYEFTDVGGGTYWFYPQESKDYANVGAVSSYQWKAETGNPKEDKRKTNGFSVRCVKVE